MKRRSFVSVEAQSRLQEHSVCEQLTEDARSSQTAGTDSPQTAKGEGGDKSALGYRRRSRRSPLGNTEAWFLLIMKRKSLALNITLQERLVLIFCN